MNEEVLQCSRGATFDELRSSYIRLAKKYHPDKTGGVSSDEFLKIQKSWDAIVDKFESNLKCPPAQSVDLDDLLYSEKNDSFVYNCRCGDAIVVPCRCLDENLSLYTCFSCSLRIRVIFEKS